jgi:hypothetical protein
VDSGYLYMCVCVCVCVRAWYFSSVFRCFLISLFIVSVILPHACPVFDMWFDYPESPLLFLIAYIYIYIYTYIYIYGVHVV